ncbi:endonuclease NucS (plasmid) [Deinococcus sp. KNUC1210]|uniref:endonuclease NucS n=1 Tax=Deinococcus sp. KNUC1210 TaxID=2917691 RepID=UPI001EF0DE1A|nr:endonuclease NucS [Deinococcus sp. KNUC1210]ULH18053.1 endonuclease NucS [Deinococcus sp. KNUC1210]
MIREQLLQPTAVELAAFLTRHTRTCDCLIQVAGQAEVTYQGRAASTADAGNYLLILKCDGSLQIHHPKGIKPMNWQPKTDRVVATLEDNLCVLTASRTSPAETVRVLMLDIQLAQALDIQEEVGFVIAGTEAQLQQTLSRHPELIEPGLTVLDRELMSSVGDIDLYAKDAQGRFVVVELKRAKATHDAVHQLSRYVDAVRAKLPKRAKVRGILAAPSITTPAALTLEGLKLEFKEIHALPSAQETAAQGGLF